MQYLPDEKSIERVLRNQQSRQAARILRNSRVLEQRLFRLIETVREAACNEFKEFDWHDVSEQCECCRGELQVVCDLVGNIRRAMSEAKGK